MAGGSWKVSLAIVVSVALAAVAMVVLRGSDHATKRSPSAPSSWEQTTPFSTSSPAIELQQQQATAPSQESQQAGQDVSSALPAADSAIPMAGASDAGLPPVQITKGGPFNPPAELLNPEMPRVPNPVPPEGGKLAGKIVPVPMDANGMPIGSVLMPDERPTEPGILYPEGDGFIFYSDKGPSLPAHALPRKPASPSATKK